MRNRLVLLGFSGSVLSLVFNTLHDLNYQNELVILENIKTDDDVVFDCGIAYHRIRHEEFEFDPIDHYAFSVMKPAIKEWLFNYYNETKLLNTERFTNILHPSAISSTTAIYNKGIYIEPGCIISPFASIGFGVSINRGCTIGHHTNLCDFSTIGPGVNIAGHCSIGKAVSIGIGATVFDHVSIGANSIIGGGSVVTKDIPENVIAFGNPCKVMKPINT